MPGVRLILAIHDHQPVGNFDDVFRSAYAEAYLPFLEVMEDYPAISFVLHTSGPLLKWLVEHVPGYVARVRAMVEAGRVEILGGGFFEPILTMIPHRDRVGQIVEFARYVEAHLGTRPRGAWLAERVWEQHLVASLDEAGVEYTALDDFHFHRAGVDDRDLRGYFLTEDEGRLLNVFPIAETLRYQIPFKEPHACYETLRAIAAERPDSVVVFADDGEKFGSWPETHQHVYTNGWLRRFCDMLDANREWIQTTTFAQALDTTLPMGKVYLPDSSYREMTEWVLPPSKLVAYHEASRTIDPSAALKPFVRAGGVWRNFKARYAETDEMYSRMLGISTRLAELGRTEADVDALEVARLELYQGQCNCPYWHGAFGGLYLPHLRNAIYAHLIAAHAAMDVAEGKSGPRVSLDVGDFNLDARQEVRLENDRLIAFVRPATGGHVYELDVRHASTNVLATLDRRPEAYHGIIAHGSDTHNAPSILDRVVLKQEGLDQRLVYDRHPRKALVDHIWPLDVTLDDLVACRDIERGDFATGTYLAKVHRSTDQVSLMMERPGLADGHPITIRKSIGLEAGGGTLDVAYVLEGLPEGVPVHFAVEINLASMAGHADDRYYGDLLGRKLGMLDSRIDLPTSRGLTLTDEWLDLAITLGWSEPAGLWCFPIETVSQSEGGFEGVYQSSAVIPHWIITAGPSRRWEVRIRWSLEPARDEEQEEPSGEAEVEREWSMTP